MGSFKLRVIEPCPVPWDAMAGGDRERHCARCARTVHNLSAMSEGAARRLLGGGDDRLCVRFFVRGDGTVVSRRRGRWIGRAVRALGVVLVAIAFWTAVVLVQRPWQAFARRLAGVPPPGPPPAASPAANDVPRFDAAASEQMLLKEAMREYGGAYGQMTGQISPAGRFDFASIPAPKRHRRR